MSLTYAIADLHGRFDLLEAAFDDIYKDAILRGPKGEKFKIVTMGDYIDRGPQSAQIIEHLMAAKAAGAPLICLKGNHEDMMVETIRKPLHPDWWIGNGGGGTLLSYGHPRSGDYDPDVVPKEHLDWLDQLPLMHVDKHRLFVHAGVDPIRSLDEQNEDVLLWWIYPKDANVGHGDRHVVHGHHQFIEGPRVYPERTNLDTFAWYSGRLVVGVFDDDVPGGAVGFIEVKKAPAERAA